MIAVSLEKVSSSALFVSVADNASSIGGIGSGGAGTSIVEVIDESDEEGCSTTTMEASSSRAIARRRSVD